MTRFPLLLLLFLLVLPQGTDAAPLTLSGKVLWVYDGDTIRIEQLGKVRLIGVDTPEKESSERDRHYLRQGIPPDRLRRIAEEARFFLMQHARGKQVTIEFDQERRDRHGRTLAYVYLPDGRLLNRLLLENGLAAVYRKFDFRLKEDFLRAEESARKKSLGLWGR